MKMTQLLFLVALSLIANFANAASDAKPFAEKYVVLQISDDDPFKQTLVLNVANNLIKHYGQDKVDVEIVAFGPGLRLMFKDNASKGRISGLVDNGVRFAACGNTISAMTKALGHPPEMNPSATVVPGGIVRIVDLVAEGYTLVKP
jgi:hypothetical protein